MIRPFAFPTLAAIALAAAPAVAQDPRIPPGSPGTVTLSRSDYDRLLDLAGRRPPGPDLLPTAAALTRADLRVRIVGATARATMRVDGEVFRAGVNKVPLMKDATLLEASMDSRALPIVIEGGTHVALINGPGPFSATLEIGTAIAYSPGRASFVLPVPHAGSATASIDVPGEQAEVHVQSGLVQRRASVNGRTVVDVTLSTGRAAQVWWSTHETAPGAGVARDVRLLADVKSVVTIGEADVRLVSLLTASVIQGEPAEVTVGLPAGYEVASVSGATLDRSETQPGRVVLFVTDASARRHQFLLSLERATAGGSFKLDTQLPTLPAAQRETGEVAIAGIGTIEIASPEMPGLRRIDVRELDPSVSAVARDSLLSAYRYQRVADEPLALTVDVRRFANAPVLAAVAERAVATTLLTAEGRALTEVTLWLRNRAQPFMKVSLPPGASIVWVEVAGAAAKPVEGTDGSRVPLLRPGFRPDGSYPVSFVYLHAGAAFLKKGNMQAALPKMDIPINLVEWELFVPDVFRADRFGGNVIESALLHPLSPGRNRAGWAGGAVGGMAEGGLPSAQRGQIIGRVTDASGAPTPGATVLVESGGQAQRVVTNESGLYIASNVLPGSAVVTGELEGFQRTRRTVRFSGAGQRVDLTLEIRGIAERATVEARSDATVDQKVRIEADAPSVNVQNLQRRASGVLPIRMDVPRAGRSHRFVKPLVIDEESVLTFRYKRR